MDGIGLEHERELSVVAEIGCFDPFPSRLDAQNIFRSRMELPRCESFNLVSLPLKSDSANVKAFILGKQRPRRRAK